MIGQSKDPSITEAMMEVVDDVRRYPHTGIRVVIAGGGIGGLMAALECWRKGCDVHVLERNESFSTLGDFFTISPSGLSTLVYYPWMHSQYHKEIYDCKITAYRSDGTFLEGSDVDWERPEVEHAAKGTKVSMLKTRAFFSRMLLDQCSRLGIKVEYGKKVIKYSENEYAGDATVETEDGLKYRGDVVLAADGIATTSHSLIPTSQPKAMPSGFAIARIAFPRSVIQPGSKAETLLPKLGERPEMRVYLAKDLHVICFLTKDDIGFAFTHKDFGEHSTESWNSSISKQELIDHIVSENKWDEALLDYFRQTPDRIVDWKLKWRNPQPVWTSPSGRVVQLGDAAHTFLPSSGNGAVQAIEDAISIAECLRLGGRSNIPWSTKVHERLRFQRTSILQRLGFSNRNGLHNANLSGVDAPSILQNFWSGKWNWGHNPERYAAEKFAECYAHLRTGAPFENTNLPPGLTYEPWTMEEEIDREKKGIPSDLRKKGDWGV